MPAEEATVKIRIAVSDILTGFLVNNDPNNKHFDALKAAVPPYIEPYRIESTQLHSELGYRNDIEWTDQRRFLFLEPISDEGIFPFLTLQSSSKWRHFGIYALLTLFDSESNLQSMALRFETDENGEGGK